MSSEGKESEEKSARPPPSRSGDALANGFSAACRLTTMDACPVRHLVLRFTTLSDGHEQASFGIGTVGGDIGRAPGENAVFVPSDATLSRRRHAYVSHEDGRFLLRDATDSDFHAAIRVGVGHAARDWPLAVGACFSAGNSVFEVVAVDEGGGEGGSGGAAADRRNGCGSAMGGEGKEEGGRRENDGGDTKEDSGGKRDREPLLTLLARTGPKKGSTIAVGADGATFGRANENTVCVADRELSRKHTHVAWSHGQFFVSDMGSTNGTYVQLVGPYAGAYPLNLNDHVLVGRTGFSVNRWDFGCSEEMGCRRTMEDKSLLVQDVALPEFGAGPLLAPQTWAAVYDGHGGEECSAFLQKRLHLEVSLSLARLAPQLKATATDAHDAITAAAAEGSSSSSSSSSSAHANGSSSGGGGSSSSSSEGAWAAFDELVMGALTEAFVATDGDFLASKGAAGSTASTVLVLGTRAYCANVGDSRTVLCRRGGHATALSDDHKPSREDEARRIKAAGGFIINKRVMGELAVSRAFGDAEFKKGISEILGEENVQDGEDEQPGTDLTKPLVVAEPECRAIDLEPDDAFLLLACDGLFDVMTNQEACDRAATELASHGDAQRAAEALSKAAIEELGSRDNVSVLLVVLSPNRPSTAPTASGKR